MRTTRNILHFALVLAVLLAGIPAKRSGDANRDGRFDLADAILRVQGVERTAEEPAAFRENLEGALITLSAAAGVCEALKSDADDALRPAGGSLQAWLTDSGQRSEPRPPARARAPEPAPIYQPPMLSPPSPPPLAA